MVRGVLRKVAMQALQGNLTAARIFLERTLGRAAEVPAAEPLDILPPRLRTAADCTAAVQKVTDGICAARSTWCTARCCSTRSRRRRS
jgi:hypothetical protein